MKIRTLLLSTIFLNNVSSNFAQNSEKPTATFKASQSLSSVEFSSDGKTLYTCGSGNEVFVLYAKTLEKYSSFKTGFTTESTQLSLNKSNNHIVVSGNDNKAIIFELPSGTKIAELTGHEHWLYSVQYDAKGKNIATGSTDSKVKIWDSKGSLKQTLKGHEHWIWEVSFSPNGKLLASAASDSELLIWNVKSGKLDRSLKGHTNNVWSTNFSKSGKYLVSGSWDETIIVWDVKKGNVLKKFSPNCGWVYTVKFSNNENVVAVSGNNGNIVLYDWKADKVLRTLRGEGANKVNELVFSKDGKFLASADASGNLNLYRL